MHWKFVRYQKDAARVTGSWSSRRFEAQSTQDPQRFRVSIRQTDTSEMGK